MPISRHAVLGLVALAAWAAAFTPVWLIAETALDGIEIEYEPQGNVCKTLTDETRERIETPVALVAIALGVWSLLGGAIIAIGGRRLIETRSQRGVWTGTVAAVAIVVALLCAVAIVSHEALSSGVLLILLVILLVPILLIASLTAISQAPAGSRGPRRWRWPVLATLTIGLTVFTMGSLTATGTLLDGPLDPVQEVSVC